MSEYLSKEEIKQWRSSLEKITLEEFAARLGKKLEEEKPTNDLADIVLHGQPVVSNIDSWTQSKTERITTIAQRAFDRENEIMPSPFSISKLKLNLEDSTDEKSPKIKKEKINSVKKTEEKLDPKEVQEPIQKKAPKNRTPKTADTLPDKAANALNEVLQNKKTGNELRDEVRIVLKKALTDREQKVFDYFAEHKNEVVYAKDLAVLLDLPRDYVYKYIKNLRAKIDGDALENAVKGGFILHV